MAFVRSASPIHGIDSGVGSRRPAHEAHRVAEPARPARGRRDARRAVARAAVADGARLTAVRVRRALHATTHGGVAMAPPRRRRAVRVGPAFDADADALVAGEAGRPALLVVLRTDLDAAMGRRLAPSVGAAVGVLAALHADMLIVIAARSIGGAVVVVRAGDAETASSLASKPVARGAVHARRRDGGVAPGVRALRVEPERAVAGAERRDEEEASPDHGDATRASASARAKPRGRARRYSRAAEAARARSTLVRMRKRSTSAFSASGPSA